MRKIFEYLDDDKDKFLNYNEFSKLNKNSKVTSRLPENKLLPHGLSATNYNMFPRAKSNDICEDKNKEDDDIDKTSITSFYYRGYKYGGSRPGRQASRLSNYSWIGEHKHGVRSPINDSIGEIINHSYANENQNCNSYHIKNLKKIQKGLPKVPTLASKLRDDYLRKQRIDYSNSLKDNSKPMWKLRQFLGVGASEDISESIKNIKKKVRSKNLSTIDHDTLPKIAEVTPGSSKPYEKVDKKIKDKLLSDYFTQKRELSSRR